jgi:heme/copper-type cytochrome/quinol oxidase subunit 1
MISQLGALASIEEGEGGGFATVLEFGAGTFSLVLFAVTLYAWFRRRQPTLLVVSFAFFTFFVKQILEILPFSVLHTEIASSILDFLTLTLFFVALVVAPKRKGASRNESKLEDADTDHIKS